MNVEVIPMLYVQWLATVDQGKQVEFLEVDSAGEEVVNGIEIGRVFADGNECQWAALYICDQAVRIHLVVLRWALDYAETTVKSERFFRQQLGEIDGEDA